MILPDPYPETVGVLSLTIRVPDNFVGDAKIVWWYPGHDRDEDEHVMTCSTTALLQGVIRHAQGHTVHAKPLHTRVIALVLHAFYHQRIERAAKLEAAYQWQAFPLEERD